MTNLEMSLKTACSLRWFWCW